MDDSSAAGHSPQLRSLPGSERLEDNVIEVVIALLHI